MSILRLTPIQLTPNAWRILIASCVIWPELFKEHNNQIILIHVFIKSESQGRLELSLMSGSEIGHHSQQALYPQEVEHQIFSSSSFFFFFFFLSSWAAAWDSLIGRMEIEGPTGCFPLNCWRGTRPSRP
jgi:hypothetical protein